MFGWTLAEKNHRYEYCRWPWSSLGSDVRLVFVCYDYIFLYCYGMSIWENVPSKQKKFWFPTLSFVRRLKRRVMWQQLSGKPKSKIDSVQLESRNSLKKRSIIGKMLAAAGSHKIGGLVSVLVKSEIHCCREILIWTFLRGCWCWRKKSPVIAQEISRQKAVGPNDNSGSKYETEHL